MKFEPKYKYRLSEKAFENFVCKMSAILFTLHRCRLFAKVDNFRNRVNVDENYSICVEVYITAFVNNAFFCASDWHMSMAEIFFPMRRNGNIWIWMIMMICQRKPYQIAKYETANDDHVALAASLDEDMWEGFTEMWLLPPPTCRRRNLDGDFLQ